MAAEVRGGLSQDDEGPIPDVNDPFFSVPYELRLAAASFFFSPALSRRLVAQGETEWFCSGDVMDSEQPLGPRHHKRSSWGRRCRKEATNDRARWECCSESGLA